LEEIPGIGEQTKFLLLKELGSVDAIKNASPEKLIHIKGIVLKQQKIYIPISILKIQRNDRKQIFPCQSCISIKLEKNINEVNK
jgi:ERCC4-type nuclease